MNYSEFKKFLEEHPGRRFDMDHSEDCAGAVFTGQWMEDKFPGPPWFNELQRRIKGGVWSGRDLLRVLEEIGDAPFPAARKRR